ncbi:MAG: ferredoxin family protein [Deltaproteobacteria bacterium]|nr:ferredoxin family protein [Deltaproteobacteria bacterium]
MTYVVTENCDNCKYTDCVDVCPVDAFHEGPTMLYINPDSCIDCDSCVEECPVEAIFPDDEVPDQYKPYTKVNEEMSRKYPVITEKKDPLPTARTIDEIKAAKNR